MTCVDTSTEMPSTSLAQDVCAVTADVSREASNDITTVDTPDLMAFDEDSNNVASVSPVKDTDDSTVNGDIRPLPITNIVTTRRPPKPLHSVGLPARAVKTRMRDDSVRTDIVSSDVSVSPSKSLNGDTRQDDSKTEVNKDAFSFVEDLLSQAKPRLQSPSLTNMQTSHSLDLDTNLGQVTRKGQHVTRSKSDVHEEGRKQARHAAESQVHGGSGAPPKTRADKLKRSQMNAVDEGDGCVMDYDRSDSPTF